MQVEDPDFVQRVTLGTTSYKFEYDFLALSRLERSTGLSFLEIARKLVERRFTVDLHLELMLAGLNGSGPETWTKAAVAKLYQGAGRLHREKLSDAAIASFSAMFKAEFTDGTAGKDPAPPPGPKPAQTGPASSDPPPAQV